MAPTPFHKTRRATQAALALAVTLLPAGMAFAQQAPVGRLLASNCFQCHGTDGRGPGFEKLAGKSANEIYKELLEWRGGKEGQGIMAKHAMGYTDAQLRALAQYFSALR